MHILTTGKQDYRGSRIKIKFRIFKIDIGSYKTIETARLFLLSENEKSKFFAVKYALVGYRPFQHHRVLCHRSFSGLLNLSSFNHFR